jgi:hypothetical protein
VGLYVVVGLSISRSYYLLLFFSFHLRKKYVTLHWAHGNDVAKIFGRSYVFLAAKKEELDVFPSYKYTRLADSNTDTKEKRKK